MVADDRHQARQVSRRTLGRSVVWTAPAVLAVAPAPVFAASTFSCPTIPNGPAAWTETVSGATNVAPRGWSNGGVATNSSGTSYTILTDANSATASTTITVSTSISVVAGASYPLTFAVRTGAATRNATFVGRIGGQTIATVSTRVGNPGVIQPPAASLSAATTVPYSGVYVATTTGTVPLTMSFTMAATTAGNNDDFSVIPSFSNCTR